MDSRVDPPGGNHQACASFRTLSLDRSFPSPRIRHGPARQIALSVLYACWRHVFCTAVLRRGDAGAAHNSWRFVGHAWKSVPCGKNTDNLEPSDESTNRRSGNPAGRRYPRALHAHLDRRNCIARDRDANRCRANQHSVERRSFRCTLFRTVLGQCTVRRARRLKDLYPRSLVRDSQGGLSLLSPTNQHSYGPGVVTHLRSAPVAAHGTRRTCNRYCPRLSRNGWDHVFRV